MQVSDVDVDKLLVHKKVTWLNSPDTMKASSLRWSPAPLRKLKNETSVRCFGMYSCAILPYNIYTITYTVSCTIPYHTKPYKYTMYVRIILYSIQVPCHAIPYLTILFYMPCSNLEFTMSTFQYFSVSKSSYFNSIGKTTKEKRQGISQPRQNEQNLTA